MILYERRIEDVFVSCANSFSFPQHLHHNLELLICIDGQIGITCNQFSHVLKKGEIMIAFPNQLHSYYKIGDGSHIMIIVNPCILPALENFFKQDVSDHIFRGGEKFIFLAQEIYNEYKTENRIEIITGYLYVILRTAFSNFCFTDKKNQLSDTIFTDCIEYIANHYTDDITLNDVASKIGITPCHLSRIFCKNLSCTFVQYVHELRIEYAKYMLATKTTNICNIAFDSGFPSIRTFNRVFKKITGTTPKEYKLQHYQTNIKKNKE